MRGKFCAPSAFPKAHSRGKMTFGFSRILTQTLTHTGIRVHGTSGTNRASERGFPSPQGRKPAGMSPHRIQTAAHNPKVVGSSPASATKQKRHPKGCFFIWFELASDGSQPPAGGTSASLKCGRNLRFPHKRPLPCCEKRGRNVESAALRSLTKKPMKPWFHRFFLFARNCV